MRKGQAVHDDSSGPHARSVVDATAAQADDNRLDRFKYLPGTVEDKLAAAVAEGMFAPLTEVPQR